MRSVFRSHRSLRALPPAMMAAAEKAAIQSDAGSACTPSHPAHQHGGKGNETVLRARNLQARAEGGGFGKVRPERRRIL